jgi:hypothetical protein
MTIVDSCPVGTPQITSSPFANAPFYYVLGTHAEHIDFVPGAIGSVMTSVVCGRPMIRILNSARQETLPSVVDVDYVHNKIILGRSDSLDDAGDFYLVFSYFNSLHPESVVYSDPFQIVIVDGCHPPVGFPTQMLMIPPTYLPEPYTITSPEYRYEVPAW